MSVPGELIGIDYLYRQTGRALQDVQPDSEETEQMLEDVGTQEMLEDEGFEDSGLDPTVGLLDTSPGPSPDTTSSAVIPTPTSLQTSARPSGPASAITTAALEQQLVIMLVTFLYHTVSVDFPLLWIIYLIILDLYCTRIMIIIV